MSKRLCDTCKFLQHHKGKRYDFSCNVDAPEWYDTDGEPLTCEFYEDCRERGM
jgi:hypothetical protein